MSTPPLWNIALSDGQARKIALVSLNWAAVDYDLGSAIAIHSGIALAAHTAELVHVLDLKKKVDILDDRRKRGEIIGRAAEMVLEMRWIANHYRPDRNMLAHGLFTSGGLAGTGVFWSASKMKALNASELDAILSEAHYAAHVANHLLTALSGVAAGKDLPQKPPERPHRG